MTLPVVTLLAWLVAAGASFAQGIEPAGAPSEPLDYEAIRRSRIVTAVRIAEPIAVDGRLEEPAWRQATPAGDFIQLRPRPGEPAQQPTEVRFLYDDTNLYVGVTCFQSPDAPLVVNELTQDFNFGQSDAINLVFDTLHDRTSGFMFMTNPGGARRDGQLANDGEIGNIDWDGVWDVKTSEFEGGWIAEFVIPFKTVRFSQAEVLEWGFNITRAVRRSNETSHWAPIPIRFSPTRVSLAGTLRGLENIRQGRNLNVKPFVVAGVSQARDGLRLVTTRSLADVDGYDGGLDAKYSLTPSLTLDATYRTDFAQVEADQQQVNLTRFNLFFPEKRDFFLENSGNFAFGPGGNLVPFFSRRIGLSGSGNPIPIVGGGRVSGRMGPYDTGFLVMKTERVDATPSNTYVVGRIKRNLLQSSWVGALVTSRNSSLADYNRVYGADARFLFYEKLEFDGYLLASDTPGRSGGAQARRFQTAWRDDEFSANAQYNEVQPNFNPEVGFIRRRNNTNYRGEASWQPQFRDSDTVQNLEFTGSVDYFEGAGSGDIETRTEEARAGIQFQNGANADFTLQNTFDRLVRPDSIQGITLSPGDYTYRGYSAGFNSDDTRKISGNASVDWGEFWDGRRKSFGGGLSVKPNHHLNVTLNYSRNQLTLANGSATTDLLGARVVYGFSSRSFFNAFLQYNSQTREVSTNVRFNIMYRPLSDVYIVYNDRRDTTLGEPVERAFIVKVTRLLTF
jgi:hypothetical protein